MTTVVIDDEILQHAQSVLGEPDAARLVERAVRELAARHEKHVIEPTDEESYRQAVEALIAFGGTMTDLMAPPRRRFP